MDHAPDGRSASLNTEGKNLLEAHETIRPLRDMIVGEPLPADLSDTLAVVERKRNLRAKVKAVGPGCYPKRYDHPDKHRRTKMWDSKVFLPTTVKPGDIVELGMVDGNGYHFESFLWGGVKHIWFREADVSGIVDAG